MVDLYFTWQIKESDGTMRDPTDYELEQNMFDSEPQAIEYVKDTFYRYTHNSDEHWKNTHPFVKKLVLCTLRVHHRWMPFL